MHENPDELTEFQRKNEVFAKIRFFLRRYSLLNLDIHQQKISLFFGAGAACSQHGHFM